MYFLASLIIFLSGGMAAIAVERWEEGSRDRAIVLACIAFAGYLGGIFWLIAP